MFQDIKNLQQLAKKLDALLPPGWGKDSLVQCSDRINGATYAMYRVHSEGGHRIGFIREGGDRARLEVHIDGSGEKIGGKIATIPMPPDVAKNELENWLYEWNHLKNPNVRLSDKVVTGMRAEERFLLRIRFGSLPVAEIDDAFILLNDLLKESEGNAIRRSADPAEQISRDRSYVIHSTNDGLIRVALEFSYGDRGGYLGQDAVIVHPNGTIEHDPIPGEPLIDPKDKLSKLNELVTACLMGRRL